MHNDFFRLKELPLPGADFKIPPPPHPYKWSDNIWIAEKGDWLALYRPLNLGLIFFQREYFSEYLHDFWKKLPRWLLDKMITERFLLPQNEDIDIIEHNRLIEDARKGTFRFICIIPTNACDLKCAYCHQRPPKGKEATMSLAEIESGLDKCAQLCDDAAKPVDILLYGGEPLNAFHITEKILKLTEKSRGLFKNELRLSFTTSGFGMTPERAEILARRNVFVIVSIDGPPECNDRVRIAPNRISAYSEAERAYFLLKEYGCRTGLSVTIGKHNIQNFTRNLAYLLDRFPANDIGLNAFLHPLDSRPNPFQVSWEEAFGAFTEGFIMTTEYGLYAEQPFRRLKPFVFRQPLLKDCSSPGERLVLAPGGKLGFCDSCYLENRYFYLLDSFPGRDNPDYQLWAGLSSPEMPFCRECPAMTVCGGACRFDAYKSSGRLDGVDHQRCEFEIALLYWMIWRLFDCISDVDEPYFFPEEPDRQLLFGNVHLDSENQPFTAGSYSDTKNLTKDI